MTTNAADDRAQLPETVRALLDPAAYSEPPSSVQLVQTQISFVVIAGDYVYKIKKPVNLGFLDYSTLDKRRHLSRREVELNRRLCPQTYLGVVPLVKAHGRINIGGRGRVVEYAVKMKRLPEERMMSALLANNGLTADMVGAVARRLADFHARAETGPAVNEFGSIPTIRGNTEENFDQTEKSVGRTISPRKYERIREYTRSFLARQCCPIRAAHRRRPHPRLPRRLARRPHLLHRRYLHLRLHRVQRPLPLL